MILNDPDLFRNAALIDGGWRSRPGLTVTNPATGASLGDLPDCTAAETEEAISASERAMKSWAARTMRSGRISCWPGTT